MPSNPSPRATSGDDLDTQTAASLDTPPLASGAKIIVSLPGPKKDASSPTPKPSPSVAPVATPAPATRAPSSSVTAPAKPGPISTAARGMVSSSSSEPSDWPDTWRDFPEEKGANVRAFFADTQARKPYWDALGLPYTTIAEDENGNPEVQSRLRPTQRASKRKKNPDDSKIDYVALTRAVSTDRGEKPTFERMTEDGWVRFNLKIAPVSEVPTLVAQGWKVENGREPPLEEESDGFRDKRPYDLPVDVLSRDQPAKDTDSYLGWGNKFMSATMTDGNWRRGQLIGTNGSDPETIRLSPSYAKWSPEPFSERRSATSTGHIIKHSAPAHVGLGWGDYDLFIDWQSYGREIPKDAVEKKDWLKDPLAPLTFVGGSGEPVDTFNELSDGKNLPVRNSEIKSLYAKLHRKKDQFKDGLDKNEWPSRNNEL